jgi:hypothetical protein
MGIKLPQSATFIPEVPDQVREVSPILYDYLSKMRVVLQQNANGALSNSMLIATSINSGTTGTFVVASGGHIKVTSGIVISVSTT